MTDSVSIATGGYIGEGGKGTVLITSIESEIRADRLVAEVVSKDELSIEVIAEEP